MKTIYYLSLFAALLLMSSIQEVRAATAEVRIDAMNFTDNTFTVLHPSSQSVTSINGGTANAGLFFNNTGTNIILGGNFLKVSCANFSGTDGIELLINGASSGLAGTVAGGITSAGVTCNGVFRLNWDVNTSVFTFVKLSNGYSGGSGDGVGGVVNELDQPSGSTKIYLGGTFTSAGGFANGRHFAHYDFSGTSGWSQLLVFPMYLTGPSYVSPVLSITGSDVSAFDTNITAFVDQFESISASPGHTTGIWSPTNKRWTVP